MPATDADPRTLETLAGTFGFASFRPGQERVVEALLAGRSALAVFPTGAGKSLCYQLPALLLDGVTVVVSPLIALMKDQIDLLTRQGVDAARLDSSLDRDELRDVTERLRAGRLKLLYVAPERFNNERFLAQLADTTISLFAVDEAHCISEWGHNFRPDYLKLAVRARELGAERVLALTATATPAVVDDICAGFGIDEADAVVTGFYRPNLTLLATPVAAAARDQLLDRPAARAAAGLDDRLRHAAAHRDADRRAARRVRPAGPGLPRRDERRGAASPCRTGGRPPRTASSSPRSRSAWASTRPTCATSTTTTCRRAWSRTPRRSAAPAATGSRACASCSPAPTTCRRWRTSPSATRPRATRWAACCARRSATSRASSSRSPSTSCPRATTCGRSC